MTTKTDAPMSEHRGHAATMVERYGHELDAYDVESAALDYIGDCFARTYGELTAEQYRAAKERADHEARQFAHYLGQLFESLEMLGVPYDTRTQAAGEAFDAFFETLPGVIGTETDADA